MWFYILIATFAIAFYKYITLNNNYWELRKVPFLKPTFFLGNFQDVVCMKASIGQLLSNIYKSTKGDLVGIWIFRTPHLIIRSPEMIKNILVKDFNYFKDRTIASDESADSLAAKGLLLVKHPEWKFFRNVMTPIFTISKIKQQVMLIDQCIHDMLNYLKNNNLNNIDAKEFSSKYMTNVITSVGFGVDAHCFEAEDADFRVIGRKMMALDLANAFRGVCYFLIPSLVSLLKLKFAGASVNDFLRKAVWDTIKQREQSGIQRNDLIDALVKIRKENAGDVKFEGDAIVAQAATFFGAGVETSSATISFTLYELGLNQDIQNTLRSELKEVFAKFGGFTYEAMLETVYLNKIIAETLRKYPSLPFLDRRCLEDYKIPETDIVIEKGTPVYIPMYGLHHDPQYFPEPDTFDPERFSEENINKRPLCAYLPFGHGPRNCIGEKFGVLATKLCLAHIITHYKITHSEKTPVPIVISPASFGLIPDSDLSLNFHKL